MNISPDKKWIELDLEEDLFYQQTKALDEPYPEVLDSGQVRIPYAFKDRIDGFNRTRGNSSLRWDNGDPISLVGWTYSSSINQEGTNTLSVFIQEGRIEASVNETLVAEVFDDTYAEGRVGVLIGGDQEVAFDDLTVGTILPLSD